MKRLVVVSNRLPRLDQHEGGEPLIPAGGMAAALFAALRGLPSALWYGWSGEIANRAGDAPEQVLLTGGVELVGTALSRSEHDKYYSGFCNRALWPLCHGFIEQVRLEPTEEARYLRVQQRFARAVHRRLLPGDVVWVHDYHLLLFARELRRLGWGGPIGLFLHIPFPPLETWRVLPDPQEWLAGLLELDVIGFHDHTSRDAYLQVASRLLGARLQDGLLVARQRRQDVIVDPIGIDPDDFRPGHGLHGGEGPRPLDRLVRNRRIVLGVDRLDYTKGIPERMLAFEALLRRHPQWRGKVSLVQVAAPSRTRVTSYRQQKERIDALVGRINGAFAGHDWVPIHYLYKSFSREQLVPVYRDADVALVTPLRDGMNLVAKEFVAAQREDDPGVLVLSRFAGAAERMGDAVIVNPFVSADVAEGLARALSMPDDERRRRHASLLAEVRGNTAATWAQRFLVALRQAALRRQRAAQRTPVPTRREAAREVYADLVDPAPA